MTHVYMPSGPSDLTNDLSDDHPIGLRYDRALAHRDQQIRPPELVDHRIKLGDRGELECVACHDPHNNELGNFLRITEREGALCTTCHEMDGWRISAHATSPHTVPATATRGEQLPYRSMADNACLSCHLSHSAPARERLLFDRSSQLCLNCHDGIGGLNVLSAIGQRSAHGINRFLEHRLPPEHRMPISGFVECVDCHNPHAALHDPLRGPLSTASATPLVAPAMRNVPGVNLAGLSVPNARLYFEVCFRCHADNPVIVPTRIFRQRDTAGNIRRQMLPTAASAHPVTFPGRGDEVTSLLPAWRSRRFLSCQDCHNNPDSVDEGGTQVNGPHGSRFDFLLVDRYETADFTTESPQAYALCYRCHDRNSILNDESFSRHRTHIVRGRSPCSACHTPHGVNGSRSQHDHLVNFDISIVGAERYYIDTGVRSGSCTLTCHGVRHVNFTYAP